MEQFGALVGWQSQDMGSRMILVLQTKHSSQQPEVVDTTRVIMTKDQAAVLANYLYEMSGRIAPDRKKGGWLRRTFS